MSITSRTCMPNFISFVLFIIVLQHLTASNGHLQINSLHISLPRFSDQHVHKGPFWAIKLLICFLNGEMSTKLFLNIPLHIVQQPLQKFFLQCTDKNGQLCRTQCFRILVLKTMILSSFIVKWHWDD